jgi:hypothetical protein
MATAFAHRTAFGVWINDMRNQALPNENWPYVVLDEQTIQGITDCLDLAARAGFNEFDVFGLLVSFSWPVDIVSAVDPERRRRVNQILDAAHQRGLKVLCGLGVYSWGFDEIIAHDPAVRGPNPHAMCGSREESWRWMARVVDFILSEFAVDGFHLESSDLGRCTCSECARQGDVQYHSAINARTAAYIKDKWPNKTLLVNMCGYSQDWSKKVAPNEVQYLVDLSRHLDALIDNGNAGHYIRPEMRADVARQLHCALGTAGGTWVYPPQRWERLRWFLPYMAHTGQHIKNIYAAGGRALEYYMGPTLNPGVEVNIAFGGRLLCDVDRSCDDVLGEVLEEIYRPKQAGALSKLASIYRRAEDAFFANWTPQTPPGEEPNEIMTNPLFGTTPEPPFYLTENYTYPHAMTRAGRAAYRRALCALLPDLRALDGACADQGRLQRIGICIGAVLADIEAIDAREETTDELH